MLTNNSKRIRHYLIWSLIFSFLLTYCSDDSSRAISIEWKDGHAAGIMIPLHFVANIASNSIDKTLHIHLKKDSAHTDILGEYSIIEDDVIFHPLIPLTRGLKYEVQLNDKLLGEIEIPIANGAPTIVAVYPTQDSLPENLLKFYIQFSKPMQEGKALEYIVLLTHEHDTAKLVFLDLQPELWNNDRTMLTLWLDPGRIKRDLQPNKQMGPPLHKDVHYQLVISKDWMDTEGNSLSQPYKKDFVTVIRDSLSPDIESWAIHLPGKETTDPLEINLHESLDYMLLNNAIRITDSAGKQVPGKMSVKEKEAMLNFIPATAWKPGRYILEVESRLEDLAGNNLNRQFDVDLANKKPTDQKEIHKKIFKVL
jgi:hypothetical protein